MNSGYTSRGFESFDRDAFCFCSDSSNAVSSAAYGKNLSNKITELDSALATIKSVDVVSNFDLLTDAITKINTRITSLDREIEKIKEIKKQKMNSNFNFNFVSFKKEELKTLN